MHGDISLFGFESKIFVPQFDMNFEQILKQHLQLCLNASTRVCAHLSKPKRLSSKALRTKRVEGSQEGYHQALNDAEEITEKIRGENDLKQVLKAVEMDRSLDQYPRALSDVEEEVEWKTDDVEVISDTEKEMTDGENQDVKIHTQSQIKEHEYRGKLEMITEGEVPGSDHKKRNEVNVSAVIELKEVSKSTETKTPEKTVEGHVVKEVSEFGPSETEKTDEKSVPSETPTEKKRSLVGLIPMGRKEIETTLPKVEETRTSQSPEAKKETQKSQPHESRGKKPKESLRPSGIKKGVTGKSKTPDAETKGVAPIAVGTPFERKVSGIKKRKGGKFTLPSVNAKKARRPGPSVEKRKTGKPQPQKFSARKPGSPETKKKTHKAQPPKFKGVKPKKSVEALFKSNKTRKRGQSEAKRKTGKPQPRKFKGRKPKSWLPLLKGNGTRKPGSSTVKKRTEVKQSKGARKARQPGSSEAKKKMKKSQPPQSKGKKTKRSVEALFKSNKTRKRGSSRGKKMTEKLRPSESKGTSTRESGESLISVKQTKKIEAGSEMPLKKKRAKSTLPKAEDAKKARRPGQSVVKGKTGKPQPRKFKGRKPKSWLPLLKGNGTRKPGSSTTKKRTEMKGRQYKRARKTRKPGSSEAKKKTKKSQPPQSKGKNTKRSVEALFKSNKTRKRGSSRGKKMTEILRPSEGKGTSTRESGESLIPVKPTRKIEAGSEMPLKKKRAKSTLPKADAKKARRPGQSVAKGKTGKPQPRKFKGRKPKSWLPLLKGNGTRKPGSSTVKARQPGSSEAKKKTKKSQPPQSKGKNTRKVCGSSVQVEQEKEAWIT
ncbi:serine/arginine repetitive matrix protein 2-like [Penaeus indicus]|uniref:serine/arginine repetitive matrix protein 2-like n=1 Tax=Penaeus indicus TaxID=29960 RepID=UPI00300D2AE5